MEVVDVGWVGGESGGKRGGRVGDRGGDFSGVVQLSYCLYIFKKMYIA